MTALEYEALRAERFPELPDMGSLNQADYLWVRSMEREDVIRHAQAFLTREATRIMSGGKPPPLMIEHTYRRDAESKREVRSDFIFCDPALRPPPPTT